MIHELGNYAFILNDETGEVTQPELPVIEDGDSFIGCSFVHFEDTKIFEGFKNLKFYECSLVNCDIPLDSETERCNTAKNEYEVVVDVEN